MLSKSLSKAVGGLHVADEDAKPFVSHRSGVGNAVDGCSGTGAALTTIS